jgi:hypothetical protein
MLERLASDLIEATEALAHEDFLLNTKHDFIRMYANVVVTTAELNLCQFDPASISLATGMITDVKFTSVPFLRFRKSLSAKPVNELNLEERTQTDLVKARENTIFIVNSSCFEEFLGNFTVDNGYFSQFD